MDISNTYLGTFFGNWLNQELFLTPADRRQHCYIIGQTGTGKSTLLHAMATQDIHQGKGIAVIDPHGTLAQKIAASVPNERKDDVIYMNVADTGRPIGLNPLFGAAHLDGKARAKRAADVLSALKGIYGYSWGVELERVLMASLLALLDAPEVRPTLLSVLQLIEDGQYRAKVATHLKNNAAWLYFNKTLETYRAGEFEQKANSTSNKMFQIMANPIVANIFGQYQPSFDFVTAMREQKILIFDLSQSVLGENFCQLMCALIASEIITASIDRSTPDTVVHLPDGTFDYDVPDFMLYIDEFQKAHSDIFTTAFSEARKYKLAMTLAHQYLDQIDDAISDAVLGNVGTAICFRVSGLDAEKLAKYDGEIPHAQFRDLGTGRALIRAMVRGKPQPTAEVSTPALPVYSERRVQSIQNSSRYRYGRTLAKVEKRIAQDLRTADMKDTDAVNLDSAALMRKQRRRLNRLVKKQMRHHK